MDFWEKIESLLTDFNCCTRECGALRGEKKEQSPNNDESSAHLFDKYLGITMLGVSQIVINKTGNISPTESCWVQFYFILKSTWGNCVVFIGLLWSQCGTWLRRTP